ncbi:unnamed protein product [Ectocarpus sp. CCAP 1310/34]|nr:unnamed protein product [Ectocarpus sp. CCAP 1310/34]
MSDAWIAFLTTCRRNFLSFSLIGRVSTFVLSTGSQTTWSMGRACPPLPSTSACRAHTTKVMVYQLKYVSLADARRSSRVSLFGAAPVPEKFGSFDDTEKYCGAVPSDHYLRDVWRTYFSELPVLGVEGVKWTREDYLPRVHQRWDGTVLAGDASFKFAKIIRLGATAHGERTRPVHGIFTVFNEYKQVQ